MISGTCNSLMTGRWGKRPCKTSGGAFCAKRSSRRSCSVSGAGEGKRARRGMAAATRTGRRCTRRLRHRAAGRGAVVGATCSDANSSAGAVAAAGAAVCTVVCATEGASGVLSGTGDSTSWTKPATNSMEASTAATDHQFQRSTGTGAGASAGAERSQAKMRPSSPAQQAQEGFLRGVLGVGVVARHGVGHPVHQPGMQPDGLFQLRAGGLLQWNVSTQG